MPAANATADWESEVEEFYLQLVGDREEEWTAQKQQDVHNLAVLIDWAIVRGQAASERSAHGHKRR